MASDLQDIKLSIQQMPIDKITPIVQSAVGDSSAVVQAGWTVETMNAVSFGTGTIGFVRVGGSALAESGAVNWSVVIKAMELNATDKQGQMASPTREVAAFESGFFEQLNGDLRAVPCHGVTRSGDTVLLWLEDLAGSIPHPWGRAEFLAISRHTGYFNGSWPVNAAPKREWLERDFATNRPQALIRGGWFNKLDKPAAARVITDLSARSGVTGISEMHNGYKAIAASLSALPRVVCHNDLHAQNAFITREAENLITYVIDWASVGLGPVGMDGGTIVGGAINWREDEARLIAEIEGDIFTEYLAGLQDAKFDYQRDQVRLGFLSNLVPYLLYYVIAAIEMPNGVMSRRFSERYGVEGDDLLDQFALRLRLFKPLFDEAAALARQLG